MKENKTPAKLFINLCPKLLHKYMLQCAPINNWVVIYAPGTSNIPFGQGQNADH